MCVRACVRVPVRLCVRARVCVAACTDVRTWRHHLCSVGSNYLGYPLLFCTDQYFLVCMAYTTPHTCARFTHKSDSLVMDM